jgi:PAS domain S-box-containing protein
MPAHVSNEETLNSKSDFDEGAAALFAGPGEVRSLARELDWSKSPLGSPAGWSPALRTMVRSMFDSPFPICLWSGPNYALVYNDAYRRILGTKHPAALGQSGATVWAEIWEELQPQFDGVRTGGDPVFFEDAPFVMARLESGGTETAWFNYSLSALRDEDESVAAILNITPETTARVLLERRLVEEQAALAMSEAQFRTFAQAMPNQSWTAQPDGMLDWFNEQVFTYSGASGPDLIGTGWIEIVHPDDLGEAASHWATALSSGSIYETEFRIRRADGDYRWHLTRALPIKDNDGAIVRWVGTNTEIHEQKLSHAESAADRNRLWTLSQDLMLVCNFDGVITAVNPSGHRMLGWTEEEMTGRLLSELIHPDDLEITAAEIDKLRQGVTTLAFKNRYRTKQEGGYRLLDWTAVPDKDHIHAVGRDITAEADAAAALAETEAALRQAQKMEAVGQLTGGIAHDFNNLLQGITGSLELVQRRVAQGRILDLDRYITGASTAANRAAALTHRLLAFSRRQPLDPKPVRANTLVASMEDLLRRTIGERVRMELVLSGGLWVTKCDPNQLESAILNLVINARDAMPDGGKLTIETCNAHLDSAYAARQRGVIPGQYICVCVTDTGTGMDADTITKAFEPFFTTKPIGKGTGLGLSMIYGFAQQSEGYAKIYSEVGKGTTFKLYLPRHRGAAEEDDAIPQLTEAHAAYDGEVVLVVEDEPIVRGLIIDELEELGYAALEAADGPEGLEILRSKRRIDLLITDIGLPGLNGRQLAEAARDLRPSLKVLFMTGYAENAALAAGFLEPGMEMITKPFAMEALATRIRSMIETNIQPL